MIFANANGITIPEGVVTKIVSAGKTLWQKVTETFKNWVLFSIDSSGNIYNSLGYKNVYRISSSGAEKSSGNQCITGFVPCKAGDVLRFCLASGTAMWTENTQYTAMNFFDSSKNHLGQITSQPAHYGIFSGTTEANKVTKNNGVWEYTVTNNTNIAFVRFTAPYVSDNGWIGGKDLIVTVNEEIV